MGYYLMTPGKNVNPTFERIECELAKTGVLARVSLSPTETRVCFEFQRGFKRRVPGRTLYVADFDAKSRTITNAKPFANEDGKTDLVCVPTLVERRILDRLSGRRQALSLQT